MSIASSRLGMRGTRMRKMFDGMCVKTIVLIRPNRLATHPLAREDKPPMTFAPNRIAPSLDVETS